MPAANPLTGGEIPGLQSSIYDVSGTNLGDETQAAAAPGTTSRGGTSTHVAILFVVAIGFLVLLRKNGFHDMIVS